jgi:tetratricopeptide (TPR) repeat protein
MGKSRLQGLIVGLLVVGVAAMGILVATSLFASRSEEQTPRTALERMIFDAELAVRQAPGSLAPRVDLAMALATGGNYGKALEQLDVADKIEPSNPEVLKLRGSIYAKMGDRAQAVKWLKKAAESENMLAEYYAEIYADIADVYEGAKDYKSAIKAYETALRYSPISTTFYLGLGRVYEKSGKLEEAKEAYETSYRMDTQDDEALAAVKRIEKELGKKSK